VPKPLRLPLPAGYRVADALAFHGRDPESPSERIQGEVLQKALWLEDQPRQLLVRISAHEAEARMDGKEAAPEGIVRRLLGLNHAPEAFESQVGEDPLFKPLVLARPGLRVLLTATPYEALMWAILGQQINLALAFRLRQRVIRRYGAEAGGGLYAHPRPEDLASANPEELGKMQVSRAKAACLISVSEAVASGVLPLDDLATWELAEAEARLRAQKGIGPWTAHYVLMRGLGLPDCVPLGDSALATALERGLKLDARPNPKEVAKLMAPYAPHRSLATFHLWAGLKGMPA
jgi:3-methyladenine DNA glycosylase/8-oxoguanine DNA glycosylase